MKFTSTKERLVIFVILLTLINNNKVLFFAGFFVVWDPVNENADHGRH